MSTATEKAVCICENGHRYNTLADEYHDCPECGAARVSRQIQSTHPYNPPPRATALYSSEMRRSRL
jgi:hypothetical protein